MVTLKDIEEKKNRKMGVITFARHVRTEPFDRLVVLEAPGTSEAQRIISQIFFR